MSVLLKGFHPAFQYAIFARGFCSGIASLSTRREAKPTIVPMPPGAGCPLCRNRLDKFGYRDVLLLRQFLTQDGYLIGRRKTGICTKMQRRITKAIRRSREMGLLPNFKMPEKT